MTMTIDPTVKIFADGADLAGVRALCRDPRIAGFTTNPTLMRQAGVTDYEAFGRDVLDVVDDRSVSFEVLSDEFDEMERQALKLASWGTERLRQDPDHQHPGRELGQADRLTVRAGRQRQRDGDHDRGADPDRGREPRRRPGRLRLGVRRTDRRLRPRPAPDHAHGRRASSSPTTQLELIWASPREILNVVQAAEIGCDIITVTHDLLKKLPLLGRDLDAVLARHGRDVLPRRRRRRSHPLAARRHEELECHPIPSSSSTTSGSGSASSTSGTST